MSKESYAELLMYSFLRSETFDAAVGTDWRAAEEMIAISRDGLRRQFETYGYSVGSELDYVADSALELMTYNSGFYREGDSYTGLFYKINPNKKNEIAKSVLQSHEVAKRIRALGQFALERALRALAEENGWAASEAGQPLSAVVSEITSAPASDRVVKFSDNQISDLEDRSSELIKAVERQNSLDGISGLRELVAGQLKAGRELIRSGCVRIYILEITMIELLRFLAKRYEREAIGGLAATLLTALAKHIGIDA